MNIDSIQDGIVIDHITAGQGMKLYRLLGLDELDVSIALIKNVVSRKLGRKDIIGFVDPGATVNFIRHGKLVEKRSIDMPETLTNVIRCKNPRCITSSEQELAQVFKLTDRANKVYRCAYCETKWSG